MEGKVIDNPDERLKQIYEAEKNRRDIMSAIRDRSKNRRDSNMHEALSDLHARLVQKKSDVGSDVTAPMALPKPSICKTNNNRIADNRIAQRWSSKGTASVCEDDDKLSEISISQTATTRKNRVAERWCRKVDNDVFSDIISENDEPVERTDSEILTTLSQDTTDVKYRRKKRQSYMERWASRAPVEAKDLDEESDVGAFEAMLSNQRKKAIDRWARKPTDEEILE
jgi:hypothetical protein